MDEMSETQITNESQIKFPSMMPGYALGGLIIGLDLMIMISGLKHIKNDMSVSLLMALPLFLGLIATVYFLVCVYNTHKTLQAVTGGSYPITAGQAVGFGFIPFFNVYWMFKWPSEIIDFVSHVKQKKEIDRFMPGLLFVIAFFVSIALQGLWYIFEFAILGILIKKIQEALSAQQEEPKLYFDKSGKVKYKLGGGSIVAIILLALLPFFIIFGILIAIAVPSFIKARDDARNSRLSDAAIKQKLEQAFSNKTEKDKQNPSSVSNANKKMEQEIVD